MERFEHALDNFQGSAWPYPDGDEVGVRLREMNASAQKAAAWKGGR